LSPFTLFRLPRATSSEIFQFLKSCYSAVCFNKRSPESAVVALILVTRLVSRAGATKFNQNNWDYVLLTAFALSQNASANTAVGSASAPPNTEPVGTHRAAELMFFEVWSFANTGDRRLLLQEVLLKFVLNCFEILTS
jgi:hypothetical protein